VQVLAELQGGQILHTQWHVNEKVDCQGNLQIEKGPLRRCHCAPRRVPEPVRHLNQSGDEARVIEAAQHGLVLVR
jgi:hypothetical protein